MLTNTEANGTPPCERKFINYFLPIWMQRRGVVLMPRRSNYHISEQWKKKPLSLEYEVSCFQLFRNYSLPHRFSFLVWEVILDRRPALLLPKGLGDTRKNFSKCNLERTIRQKVLRKSCV